MASLDKLLHPPKPILILVPPAVFAALVFILVCGKSGSALSYSIYCMSAYCLLIWALPVPGLIKRAIVAVKARLSVTVFGGKYINDVTFRNNVGIYQGMIANFLYVIFRIAVGIDYASAWFVSAAIYYLVLGGLRLFLVLGSRGTMPGLELHCYRRTAFLLFLLNIPMGGMILLMVFTNSCYYYPGHIIYLSAIYTFYAIIRSVSDLVRFRKLDSPILSAAKVLNFVAALMSVLCLQTTMIAQFSSGRDDFRIIMNGVTGTAIWFTVILTAIFMLRRSAKAIVG